MQTGFVERLFDVRSSIDDDPAATWRPRQFDPCLDCWQQGRIRVPDPAFDPASFLANCGSAGLDVVLLRPVGAPGCPHGGEAS